MAEETVAQTTAGSALGNWRAWLARLRSPGPREIAVMAGGAAVLAMAIAATLWSRAPDYEALYRGLEQADAGAVMDALQQAHVEFKVDPQTGALMVPRDSVHETRLKLASQGLPRGAPSGFEMLDQGTSLGVSQFMETARYQRALEGELARTIMSIGTVKNARVHLALPKETVFVRDRQPPSASVLVQLQPGRVLDNGQVAAIVHLVSSSVPKLGADQVSVIDQAGNLLTRPGGDQDLALSLDQLEYARRMEEHYANRIEEILTPILGRGKVRAQVALDLDFAVAEETTEAFDPKQAPGSVRSERLLEDLNANAPPVGIPGAVSNQPPGAASVPQQANTQTQDNQSGGANPPQHQRKETTRNYELDKRTSRVRQTPGRIKRLSAAVVLDDKLGADKDGNPARTPLTPQEVDRITALVKDAVGFDTKRGDTVNVMNATFAASPFDEAPEPWWRQEWLLPLLKWLVIGIVLALFLLLVARPLLNQWLAAQKSAKQLEQEGKTVEGNLVDDTTSGLLEDRVELSAALPPPDPLQQLDERLKAAKALVAEDPKRALQVIKNWMMSEEG